MMPRSKKSQSNEVLLRKDMKHRATLNGYIKYYEDLLSKNIILPNSGAYKRLVQLKERYVRTY
tara:strand:+ start:7546 stop:7734 length:189 start_codon:yes stop_codon:yes gene_type:complete